MSPAESKATETPGGYADELKKHLLTTTEGGGLLQEKTLGQGVMARVIHLLLDDPSLSLERIALLVKVPAVYLRGHVRTPLFRAAYNEAQKAWLKQKELEGVSGPSVELTDLLAYHEGASPQDMARSLQAQVLARLSQHVMVETEPNKLLQILSEVSKVVPAAPGTPSTSVQNNTFIGGAVPPDILAAARQAALQQVLIARPPRLELPDEHPPSLD